MVDDTISYSLEGLGEDVSEDEIMEDIRDDLEEDELEDNELMKEELSDEGFTPKPEIDMNPVAFIERNINKFDKISVSNLTPEELGRPTLPVRFWRQYASLFDGKTFYNMPLVYAHLLKKAQINEATSLSREAKALELAITNKRIRERKSSKAVSDFIEHIKNKQGQN